MLKFLGRWTSTLEVGGDGRGRHPLARLLIGCIFLLLQLFQFTASPLNMTSFICTQFSVCIEVKNRQSQN